MSNICKHNLHVYTYEDDESQVTFKCVMCGKTIEVKNSDAEKFKFENFIAMPTNRRRK